MKLGCKGPVVKCNVPVRGWVDGYGGCPNVGGICMACTMPGFPDKFMPFMDAGRGGRHGGERSSGSPSGRCSSYFRHRNIKNKYDVEPEWRKPGKQLLTGYQPRTTRVADRRAQPTRSETERRQQMATVETPRGDQKVMVKEMSWDPITRIVGSLGIHTEIDFSNQEVLKCYSTSMIFRGFDIFMKGIDPRDAHFITSRICGICGDNHCTCSCLNQNMAYGVKPPPLGDLAFNLAETADYMFDHAIFNDCMCNVDFCEQMVKETNPSLLQKAEQELAPHSDIHGYRTIADIMRSLNPFTGEFYLETLQVARYTREMYCLFGGRHTHPSTIMPGRLQRAHHAPDADRLLRAPDALLRLRQAQRADARRPLRLLPPGAAGVRHGRLPRHEPRQLGLLRRPGLRRLQLREHERVGQQALHHPRASRSTAS